MTNESVLEWAKGWLRDDTADDPTFRQRFLDGLEEELAARTGAIHLLCDGILSAPTSPPSLVALANDARNMIHPEATCPDDVVCDRCGKVPGVARDGRTPYCHFCMHECTFTRAELSGSSPQ